MQRLFLVLALWTSYAIPFAASSDVSWFLHVSDLHLSEVDTARASDLNEFLRNQLPQFHVSAVLVTGDLVHAKEKRRRSKQLGKEWEQYQDIILSARAALNSSQSAYLDIRGNHDAFDASLRNGTCPVICLVGVDLSPEIGLRSPTNFFGVVTDAILHELEVTLAEDMRKWYGQECDPVYIAYGHYPLSMAAKEAKFFATRPHGLAGVLQKYSIAAWFCGHLHDAFGDHLHRLHEGDASVLLELEVTDWKEERRFRILAVDARQISFLDLEVETKSGKQELRALDPEVKLDGAVVLMTSPPSPYFAPLGNRLELPSVSIIRALVWPLERPRNESSLIVTAAVYCKDSQTASHTVPMTSIDGGTLYEAVLESSIPELCQYDKVHVQIQANINGTEHVSLSEKREIEERRKPRKFPHDLQTRLVLSVDWCALAQNLFTSMILFHIFLLLLLPKSLSLKDTFQPKDPTLDEALSEQQSEKSKWSKYAMVLMGPVHAFVRASRFAVFWWGQLCFTLYLLFGPWFFARVISGRPLGILFVPTIYVRPDNSQFHSMFSPEMPFRACIYYTTVVFPTTLCIVWTLHRWTEKANGTGKRYRITLFFYSLAGLVLVASLGRSMVTSWMYYGPLSVFLSPVYIGWIVLNGLTLFAAMQHLPKCRKE